MLKIPELDVENKLLITTLRLFIPLFNFQLKKWAIAIELEVRCRRHWRRRHLLVGTIA